LKPNRKTEGQVSEEREEKAQSGEPVAEVDLPPPSAAQAEELAVYEKLRRRVQETLADTREALRGEVVRQAVERAGEELKQLGGHSRDTVSKVTAAMRKDLASTAEALKPRLEALGREKDRAVALARERGGAFWHEHGEEAGRALRQWRDRGGALLAEVLHALSEWSGRLGDRVDSALVYRTGEATDGGAFVCAACGTGMRLKKPGHLPPCPRCHKTEFRRA
jgi:hypothetical protein